MSRKVEHNVVRILYVLTFGVLSLYLISPFFISLIFAGTVALAMYPLLLKLERKGLKRKSASALLTTIFAVVISIPFSFFVIKGTIAVTEQLEKFSKDVRYKDQGVSSIVKTIRTDLMSFLQKYSDKMGLSEFMTEEKLNDYIMSANTFLLQFFQGFLGSLPVIFLYCLIMILCTYSFLKHAHGVRSVFQKMFGLNDQKMDQLIKIFLTDSRQVYVSNIVTGSVQSSIVATGVSLLGLGDFFLVFFVTLILSFIPVIGAAPVALAFAIVAFFKGQISSAIILIVVGVFTGVIDNFLRPYLASLGETKAPPIVSFVFVIGGALLMGFPGLFIGLLVGSIAYDSLPLFWNELGAKALEKKSLGKTHTPVAEGHEAEENQKSH